MRIRQTLPIVLLIATVLVIGSPADAQTKAGTKHPGVEALSDCGPTAKRQANFAMTEVLQYFDQIDKLMASDNTTKSHMDNALSRATARSVNAWDARRIKILDAYAAWAKRQGRKVKDLPPDWRAFFLRTHTFLGKLDNQYGPMAIAWRRRLNLAGKRFTKYAKVAPNVMEGYKADVEYADGELREARTALRTAGAKLSDLKQRRRHLTKVRTTIKNLKDVMLEQQKLGVEVFAPDNKTYSTGEFKKGLTAIVKWKDQCAADDTVPAPCKELAEGWVKLARTAYRKYVNNYALVKRVMGGFLQGKIFDDSEFFRGVKYDKMVGVVDKMIEQVDARIKKIAG